MDPTRELSGRAPLPWLQKMLNDSVFYFFEVNRISYVNYSISFYFKPFSKELNSHLLRENILSQVDLSLNIFLDPLLI